MATRIRRANYTQPFKDPGYVDPDEAARRLRRFQLEYGAKPSRAMYCLYRISPRRALRRFHCNHLQDKPYCGNGKLLPGFDHNNSWKDQYGKVGIITTQPYDLDTEYMAQWDTMCEELDLVYDIRPELSWHYPGATTLVVFVPYWGRIVHNGKLRGDEH